MRVFLFTREALLREVQREVAAGRKVACGYDGNLGIYWMRRYHE